MGRARTGLRAWLNVWPACREVLVGRSAMYGEDRLHCTVARHAARREALLSQLPASVLGAGHVRIPASCGPQESPDREPYCGKRRVVLTNPKCDSLRRRSHDHPSRPTREWPVLDECAGSSPAASGDCWEPGSAVAGWRDSAGRWLWAPATAPEIALARRWHRQAVWHLDITLSDAMMPV